MKGVTTIKMSVKMKFIFHFEQFAVDLPKHIRKDILQCEFCLNLLKLFKNLYKKHHFENGSHFEYENIKNGFLDPKQY